MFLFLPCQLLTSSGVYLTAGGSKPAFTLLLLSSDYHYLSSALSFRDSKLNFQTYWVRFQEAKLLVVYSLRILSFTLVGLSSWPRNSFGPATWTWSENWTANVLDFRTFHRPVYPGLRNAWNTPSELREVLLYRKFYLSDLRTKLCIQKKPGRWSRDANFFGNPGTD